MGFWSWHNRMMRSKEPVIQYAYKSDGDGNSMFAMDFFGSKVKMQKGNPHIENKDEEYQEFLEYKRRKQIE